MAAEIRAAREAGANGVVLGALDEHRRVHEGHLERLLACAEGMEVTFHRAIDAAEDPVSAAERLSRYAGIRTILTSGGPGPIEAHTGVLAAMRAAADPLRIMAGGGLTRVNAASIIVEGHVHDVHFGTAVRQEGKMDGALDPVALAALKGLLVRCGLS
jgi:copper homeostasis protein